MDAGLRPRTLYCDWNLERRMVTWSGPLEEVVGWRPHGSRVAWDAHIAAEDRAAVDTLLADVRAGRRPHGSVRYRVATANGDTLAVEESAVLVEHLGRPQGVVGAIRPVEERPADRGNPSFVDALPVLAWDADADGFVRHWNAAWYAYTGTTRDDAEGWAWLRVHDPLDVPRVLRGYRDAVASGRPWEDELLLRAADGALRWHLVRAMPVRDDAGNVVRWVGAYTDTHARRRADEEHERLLHAEQRLRRAAEDASSEKDALLSSVAHELRTPLSTLLTRIEMLETQADVLPAGVGTSAHKMRTTALGLAALVDDLLDVSRLLCGRLEIDRAPVALVEPVQQALYTLDERARAKGIALRLTIACSPLVVGCPARLQRIVRALVDNAIRHGEPATPVDVTIEADGAGVVVSVHDEGRGIPAEQLPGLFERIGQQHGNGGSLGLGLPIAHALTELHGGTLTAESEGLGRGATFRVRLPVAGETAARTPPPTSPAARADAGPVSLTGIHVLGVDDDPQSREVLAMTLISHQANVTVAGSAADALEQLRLEVPDVIVSDIAMPDVDGYGFVERVRAVPDPRLRALPIIALTAHASARDRDEALRRGFSSYVSKPFDSASLARLIADLLASRPGN